MKIGLDTGVSPLINSGGLSEADRVAFNESLSAASSYEDYFLSLPKADQLFLSRCPKYSKAWAVNVFALGGSDAVTDYFVHLLKNSHLTQ